MKQTRSGRREHAQSPQRSCESRVTAHRLASFDPKDVGAVLLADFRAAAGSQALFRAFLAERDNDRLAARFWLDVYETILKSSR
jgi:hypothetical protein